MGKWDEWVRQRSEFDKAMQRYEDERRPPMTSERPTVSAERLERVAIDCRAATYVKDSLRAAATRIRELEEALKAQAMTRPVNGKGEWCFCDDALRQGRVPETHTTYCRIGRKALAHTESEDRNV